MVKCSYEKNLTNPELYEAGGVTHYIMPNIDSCLVVWKNGNVECSISGVKTMEEVKKIINSIYEG